MAKKTKKRLGPVTADVKFKILKLRAEGMTEEDIAREVERPVKSINRILLQIEDMSGKAFDEGNPRKEGFYPTQQIRDATLQDLVDNMNLDEIAGIRRINRVVDLFERGEIDIPDQDTFLGLCRNTVNGSELFGTKTEETGRGGVTIMTKAASESGDSSTKNSPPNNHGRVNNQTIFSI